MEDQKPQEAEKKVDLTEASSEASPSETMPETNREKTSWYRKKPVIIGAAVSCVFLLLITALIVSLESDEPELANETQTEQVEQASFASTIALAGGTVEFSESGEVWQVVDGGETVAVEFEYVAES